MSCDLLLDTHARSGWRQANDRMLIAQALAEESTIATTDPGFSRYEGLSVIWP